MTTPFKSEVYHRLNDSPGARTMAVDCTSLQFSAWSLSTSPPASAIASHQPVNQEDAHEKPITLGSTRKQHHTPTPPVDDMKSRVDRVRLAVDQYKGKVARKIVLGTSVAVAPRGTVKANGVLVSPTRILTVLDDDQCSDEIFVIYNTRVTKKAVTRFCTALNHANVRLLEVAERLCADSFDLVFADLDKLNRVTCGDVAILATDDRFLSSRCFSASQLLNRTDDNCIPEFTFLDFNGFNEDPNIPSSPLQPPPRVLMFQGAARDCHIGAGVFDGNGQFVGIIQSSSP